VTAGCNQVEVEVRTAVTNLLDPVSGQKPTFLLAMHVLPQIFFHYHRDYQTTRCRKLLLYVATFTRVRGLEEGPRAPEMAQMGKDQSHDHL
jgi:hypothetical protein